MIKKWLSTIGFKLTQHRAAELPTNRPHRQLCLELLERLDAQRFKHYHPSQGLSETIATPYTTIDAYTRQLKELAGQLKQERILGPDWASGELTIMSVDRFFVSIDGYYLNIVDAVEEFQKAAITVCELMEASDEAEFGTPEHNLRMLTKLFINLRMVATKLTEISLQTTR